MPPSKSVKELSDILFKDMQVSNVGITVGPKATPELVAEEMKLSLERLRKGEFDEVSVD